MTTQRSLTVLMFVAALGAPLAAAGQTTPPPKPAPMPQPSPAPTPDPLTIVMPDLSVLQDPTWLRSLQNVQMPTVWLPDVKLPDLPVVAWTTAANDAMEKARLALEDARWEFQDNMPYRLTMLKSEGDYSAGKDLLSQHKFDDAIGRFDHVIAQKSTNADGALYWKAYAQFKLGKTDDALATLAALKKDHPQSRYLTDGKALEADAKRMAGQPVNPATMNDDELKVLAINGIKSTDPERAIPLLEGVLTATNSLSVKKQALYVLASMSDQPKAHQILLSYAKGAGNPDLQAEAIRYIAVGSDKQTTAADLMQIYQSTQDADVRMAVIDSLRTPGSLVIFRGTGADRSALTLRDAAPGRITILGPTDLWTLYEKESNKDLRLQIVNLFGAMQANDQIDRVIRIEKDQDVVRRAIRSLGTQPAAKTGQLLIDLYGTEQDPQTRKTVIGALASQNNAEGLVAIARKEGTLDLKKEIVRYLSEMAPKSKVAADYLLEIIK